MVQWRGRVAGAGLLFIVALALAACGDSTILRQAQGTGALTTASVRIEQSGPAHVQIDASHVTFQIDNSGTLVVNLTLRSSETSPKTLTLRASLYDSGGTVIGTATGGVVSLASGASTPVQLNGSPPNGTIAAARFEVTAQGAPG
ncbi:MAG TPA: hypothetical protein VNY76_00040 [Candidatus Acidoferrales bacterium]|jgi:hypothetical protein|nr:hypothetical protein [Candidatus Acidoferrales bacterium]